MKKGFRIIIILLLMAGTLATFAFIGLESRMGPLIHVPQDFAFFSAKELSPSDRDSKESHADTHALVMADTAFSLGLGETYQCSALYDDGNFAEGLLWNSSDPIVAEVDAGGKITANAEGETTVTASLPDGLETSVTVYVYGDIPEAIHRLIPQLASVGDDNTMNAVLQLAQKLAAAKRPSARTYGTFLTALVNFYRLGKDGSGTGPALWTELNEALAATHIDFIDEQLLRQAALTAYCQGEKAASDVTVSFTGDCTFGYFNETDSAEKFPSVYENAGSVTYPFDLTKNIFAADHLTMINFEGTLTTSRNHRDKAFYFRGPPAYTDILTHASVEAATLENNHSHDYFEKGYDDTLLYLTEAGVLCATYEAPAAVTINGCRVVMIALSMVDSSYKVRFKEQVEQFINEYRDDKTVIIVNLHWGQELATVPSPWQIEAAHSIIDAGADMIIGHHPHVPQGIEVYNGHYIVYSLGNFSFGGNSAAFRPATCIFRASFSQNDSGKMRLTRVSIVPCYTTSSGSTSNNYKPTPVFGEDGKAVVDQIVSLSAQLDGGVNSLTWSRIP